MDGFKNINAPLVLNIEYFYLYKSEVKVMALKR